jgi:uracil-DNA glycosylase family 4
VNVTKQAINIVKELGITQWRLRKPPSNAIERPLQTKTSSPAAAPELVNTEVEAIANRESSALPTSDLSDVGASSNAQAASLDLQKNTSSRLSADSQGAAENQQLSNEEVVQTQAISADYTRSWGALESAFEQRLHCGQNLGLKALPFAGQRQSTCAIILPAPTFFDLNKQQAHSESSQRLLTEILRALAVSETNTYQTNSIKCAGEALNQEPCAEWVHAELQLLSPKLCLVFGEPAARAVLKTNHNLDVLRGTPQAHPFLPVQCLVTHSLEDMLSKPNLKLDCWHDLRTAAEILSRT